MQVTVNNIGQAHAKCIHEVIMNDYYTGIANTLLEKYGEPWTTKDIVMFWHRFWESLPDSKSIQRDPFYLICDIAENIFDPEFMGEPDEQLE